MYWSAGALVALLCGDTVTLSNEDKEYQIKKKWPNNDPNHEHQWNKSSRDKEIEQLLSKLLHHEIIIWYSFLFTCSKVVTRLSW